MTFSDKINSVFRTIFTKKMKQYTQNSDESLMRYLNINKMIISLHSSAHAYHGLWLSPTSKISGGINR